MKKTIFLAALSSLVMTGCANTQTHMQALTEAIANVDAARQALTPLVTANCTIVTEALPVIKPELVGTTKTICDLLNGANAAFNAMPSVTNAPAVK